ncbi:uncharacterized protein SPSK_03543 [Sporothrix schenckii 1099-18]|uniref:U-box domain-containing protein n=1 Tax=Sporothrix schenckii 1099-18 TaxID=1397361 RepID=A0A0F2LYJ2_SPOSC|nr:uncharacterized protein SPSK_03543 [Sporothrix schenckii 1099-18]KJR81929.1 hypothetical protein SPSK_03543 [Sporothrix schenckii 1099-18]
MEARANSIKAEGNKCFQRGDFAAAEGLYSQAIIVDPKNSALYTNRALVRLKLEMWGGVVDDCTTCLERVPDNMKALYYLSQAELQLRDFDAAVAHCRRAHALCVQSDDKSLTNITNHMLDCKRARWNDMEKHRLREAGALEGEMVELAEREKASVLASLDASKSGTSGEGSDTSETSAEYAEIAAEWDAKIARLRETFERSRAASAVEARRTVPDWAIDDITFAIMVDPVVTNTGKSYERAAIMEHLRRQHTDPLTREQLLPSDLRPNLALRAACEEFLDQNGWAVDW